ncbi:MAG: putative serine/threonine-protein kinase Nek3 [Streblomastix strix]|uniref:non-specific serine/threonine protein kinase n=1 Tax=Streblomastix strix TaxID=222440 RepID=A0A5J4WSH5_9EUKA|nr:MAG: putative serine/threonine-protein kinase Nek3 [Streblomastix strix]
MALSRIKRSDYTVVKGLGQGSFGSTFLVSENSTGKYIAWKRITIINEDHRRMAQAEADMLSRLKNEFLVKFIGTFEEESEFYILMEYCDKGDLRKYLNNLKEMGAAVTEDKLWDLFAQMTEAVHSLHSQNIIHRDLKPENVFLTEKFQIKLGDLGMARISVSRTSFQTRIAGTIEYFPPELQKIQLNDDDEDEQGSKQQNCIAQQTKETDMFALGEMFYEMITLRHPFANKKGIVLQPLILKCKPDPLPQNVSESMKQIVMQMIQLVDHLLKNYQPNVRYSKDY